MVYHSQVKCINRVFLSFQVIIFLQSSYPVQSLAFINTTLKYYYDFACRYHISSTHWSLMNLVALHLYIWFIYYCSQNKLCGKYNLKMTSNFINMFTIHNTYNAYSMDTIFFIVNLMDDLTEINGFSLLCSSIVSYSGCIYYFFNNKLFCLQLHVILLLILMYHTCHPWHVRMLDLILQYRTNIQ